MFDIDKYYREASFEEIFQSSPFFNNKRRPSLINEENDFIYLSTLDVICKLSDEEGLQLSINKVKSYFERRLKQKDYYCAAMAKAEIESMEWYLGVIQSH